MFFCISALLYTVFTLFWSFCTWFPFFWWILYGQFEIDHIWGQLWTVYETQKLTVCKEKHDISEGEICTQQDSVRIVFVVKVGGQIKLRELNMYIYFLFTFLIIEFSSTEDHESYISKGSEVVIVCLQKLEVWSFYYQHNTTVAQKSRLNQKRLKLKYVFILE